MKKRMRITVNGQTYEVEAEILDDQQTASSAAPAAVEAAATVVTPTAAPKTKVVSSGTSGVVPSPIAGTVVSIAKPAGSEVAAGEVLLVLEAMKMNTEVTAPSSGKITEVNVSQGESVEEGQALMTIA
ncbi:biotin/lipoyl-containing protein [Desulfogranum marinum]|uniref:biotin/lipoyl-containing protein n=1 Tax=Desulfogranum marinum TaxID=453220 RepID=UPI001962D5CA|nr:biotin/lipoyl-containing protein [Desulfogranum marinum]MBM9511141.1 biotin/lipoyl-binding protein [Desulfogranum marinum]